MSDLITDTLVAEYQSVITSLGADATDEQIITSLVEGGDWTKKGARVVVTLAREYGVFVLRNALALADALGIEDGASRI